MLSELKKFEKRQTFGKSRVSIMPAIHDGGVNYNKKVLLNWLQVSTLYKFFFFANGVNVKS